MVIFGDENSIHMKEQEAFQSRFIDAADMQSKIGSEIGISKWQTIDQDTIDTFARTTGDQQWIHTDPTVAKLHSPYGTTIAHGFLVLSMAPAMMYEIMHVDNAIMVINYGLDKVRFPHAVTVGSKIRARAILTKFESWNDGIKLTLHLVFEIENMEKPACIADFIVLILTDDKEDI